MDGAAGVVAGEPRQVQRLGDDALAGERRVAVNQDRQRACAPSKMRRARLVGAACPRRAPCRRPPGSTASRWLGFGAIDTYIWPRGAGGAGAGVILHVAHPAEVDAQRLRRDRILELGEDLRVRLLQHVREHVQPAAMRHAEHRVPRAVVGGAADDLVEDRHQHVEPLDREARLAGEGALQEALEHLDLRDAVEQRLGAVPDPSAAGTGPTRRRGAATRALRARTRARSRSRWSSSRRGAASRSPRRRWPTISADRAADERRRQPLQVVVGDAVRRGRQRRVADRLRAERIDARGEMAVAADATPPGWRRRRSWRCRGYVRPGVAVPGAGGVAPRWRPRGVHDLERLAGFGVDRVGILPVSLVQLQDVAGVDSLELIQTHGRPVATLRLRVLVPRERAGVLAGHRVERTWRVARLLELLERLAAHGRVDVQVRHADHCAELFQHEEDHAVVDHAAPVAAAHQVALLVGQSGVARTTPPDPRGSARRCAGSTMSCRNLFSRYAFTLRSSVNG